MNKLLEHIEMLNLFLLVFPLISQAWFASRLGIPLDAVVLLDCLMIPAFVLYRSYLLDTCSKGKQRCKEKRETSEAEERV